MNLHLAEYELSAGTSRQLPNPTLPEIVFSGKSNVGKSSLLNKLLNRKALARVSAAYPKQNLVISSAIPDTLQSTWVTTKSSMQATRRQVLKFPLMRNTEESLLSVV
jgi:ribosome biogenesis GTPase A